VGKTYGRVNVIDASAILGVGAEADVGTLHVFAVNRSLDEAAPLSIELADGEIEALEGADVLYGSDPTAVNTFERPDRVRPQTLEGLRIVDGKAQVELPPLSVAAMTFSIG
jgi:alpha-N-arabinofuranosidase